jgi:hypothetical protein
MKQMSPLNRSALEARWLELTKETLPALAVKRKWPIQYDHCFQRVMLDAACGRCWYEHISHRPAYRCATDDILERAVSLAESVADGAADLNSLNQQSLQWRQKPRKKQP